MKNLLNKLKQIIKTGYLSTLRNDSSDYPQAEVTYNEKKTNIIRLSPYGLCSQPPVSSLVVLLSNQAQESLKYGIIDDMPNRFKNLAEGEVCIYNYMSGSYVHFKANGDIDVYGSNNLTAEIVGSITATASDATITASTITLDGDVTITGDLTVNGQSTLEDTTTIETKVFLNHTHSQNNDSNGDTQQETNGVT